METSSTWLEKRLISRFPSLSEDLHADVVVVGGGLTGITTAYLLKKAGHTVVLLERGRLGGVDTSYTTAHLTCVTDTRLHQLVSKFGRQGARSVWEAGQAAIDQVAANIDAEEINCEFKWVPGYLHGVQKKADVSSLQQDAELAQEFEFPADYVQDVPYFAAPGVKFAHQAKFHPLKYLAGLIKTIPGGGSHVFENTNVTEFEEKPLGIKAGPHSIRCKYLVIATHSPLTGNAALVAATLLTTKLYPYTSYVLGAKVPSGLLPEALFWDTEEPYHYLRVEQRRGFDYVIFGGEDHKTGQVEHTEQPYARLERTLLRRIPSAQIERRWSGQVIETNDGLPFMGETATSQFAATGFSGNGMTFGTLGAMMAVDAFLERKNPWSGLFSPSRKKFHGGTWQYLKENKDYPYYLVRDWVGRAEGKSLRTLRRGEGKILNLDGKKVAAYRDEEGTVSLCSPVCTHLKCIVHWNETEHTWDCPCHGSRFKCTGAVMSGPAESDLEKIERPS